MDIKQMLYFVTIAKEGSFSAAARKLKVSQPAISNQMRDLEDELDIKLMIRGSRRVDITNPGRLFLKRAEEILSSVDDTIKELKLYDHRLEGTLSIGVDPSYGAFILTKYLSKFRQQYPHVHYMIKEGAKADLLEMLKSGLIDIAFIHTPITVDGLECVYLNKEPLAAAAWAEYFDSKMPMELEIKQLKDRPLILHHEKEALVASACESAGFSPNVICQVDDDRSALLWAVAGNGIALVPQSALRIVRDASLVCQVVNHRDLTCHLAGVWNTEQAVSDAAKQFIRIVHTI